jgi:hypothetical protein
MQEIYLVSCDTDGNKRVDSKVEVVRKPLKTRKE